MAAATVDSLASKVKDGFRKLETFFREAIAQGGPRGFLAPVGGKVTVATTNIDDIGDILRLSLKFPKGTIFHGFTGTPSDMDSGTAHVYDIVVVDESDNVLLTLVSASTKSQAATGTDEIAAAARHRWASADCYIAMKTTTAASTAVAGTYHWGGLVSLGWLKATEIGIFLGDARA